MLSACISNQPVAKSTAITPNSTTTLTIPTPTTSLPREEPASTDSPEGNPCIPHPETDNVTLTRTPSQINLAQYDINMATTSEPIWSPNDQYLALSLYEQVNDKRISHLAVLDVNDNTITLLLEYQSVDWSNVDIAWSSDSKWIAFLPGNVAYGDDGGLWIFGVNNRDKYHQKRATSLENWDEKSQNVYFYYKDAYGFFNVTTWTVTVGERCP
jgi:hypothetical protein